MDWNFLLMVLLVFINFRLLISEEKPGVAPSQSKSSNIAKRSYRYQPSEFSKCRMSSECDLYHKHLLLATGSTNYALLKECSLTTYLHNVADLDRHLSEVPYNSAIIVVYSKYYHHRMYMDILKVMIHHLGNVTLYVDNERRFLDAVTDCDTLQNNTCTNLLTLTTVIQQSKNWRPTDSAFSSTALDLYDSRWLPMNMLTPVTSELSSVDVQLQILAMSFCARNRRYNIFYEILPKMADVVSNDLTKDSEHEDDYYESEDRVVEASLVLEDILPIDPRMYDKNRPPKTRNQPTIVYFHVTVLSIDSINEESMTYVADIFLAQSWRDQRLRLPESMNEYRILNVDWLHDIWKPDSFFKNAKHVTFHEISVPNHYLWLYHDKTLLYMSKLSLVLSCAMKFESYPHDTQVCSMMIESLSHTTDDLIFKWNTTDPLVMNLEIELPQLDIVKNFTDDCTNEYSTGNFTCLAVVFSLKRRLGYHLFHTYIPSALIVVMSWISFWIKPEAIPARVTLGVTSLLTLATQNTQSQQSLPPVSYVKAIDIWMSSCSVFVFLSLMEFAIVNNYMGPVATKTMKGYSDEDLRIVDDIKELELVNETSTRYASNAAPQYVTCCNGKAVAIYIDQFSRIFFPASFIVLNIIYWTAFL